MKTIYLDVSCLNRPFDDQRQPRIRMEAEAITLILQHIDAGRYTSVSSQMAEIEIGANTDFERRRRVMALLPPKVDRIRLTPGMFRRAEELVKIGLKSADALHVAAAEASGADVLLSCDDRLCRAAVRARSRLAVRVVTPLDWLKEESDVPDA